MSTAQQEHRDMVSTSWECVRCLHSNPGSRFRCESCQTDDAQRVAWCQRLTQAREQRVRELAEFDLPENRARREAAVQQRQAASEVACRSANRWWVLVAVPFWLAIFAMYPPGGGLLGVLAAGVIVWTSVRPSQPRTDR